MLGGGEIGNRSRLRYADAVSNLRAAINPGWAECELTEYAGFEDLREELEALRELQTVHAVLVRGRAFPTESVLSEDECRWLELFDLPTLFMFAGELTGAGLQVALSCDIRVCGPAAVFRVPIGSRRSLQLIGAGASADLLPARGRVNARQALEVGVVSHVAESEDGANVEARRLAAVIASRGPIAVRLAKEAIWRGLDQGFDQALRFETDLTLLLQTTKDRAEGVRAFLEKRQPNFIGE